jgi:hypothetical protein
LRHDIHQRLSIDVCCRCCEIAARSTKKEQQRTMGAAVEKDLIVIIIIDDDDDVLLVRRWMQRRAPIIIIAAGRQSFVVSKDLWRTMENGWARRVGHCPNQNLPIFALSRRCHHNHRTIG